LEENLLEHASAAAFMGGIGGSTENVLEGESHIF
jgi:hypothetical protein